MEYFIFIFSFSGAKLSLVSIIHTGGEKNQLLLIFIFGMEKSCQFYISFFLLLLCSRFKITEKMNNCKL